MSTRLLDTNALHMGWIAIKGAAITGRFAVFVLHEETIYQFLGLSRQSNFQIVMRSVRVLKKTTQRWNRKDIFLWQRF